MFKPIVVDEKNTILAGGLCGGRYQQKINETGSFRTRVYEGRNYLGIEGEKIIHLRLLNLNLYAIRESESRAEVTRAQNGESDNNELLEQIVEYFAESHYKGLPSSNTPK